MNNSDLLKRSLAVLYFVVLAAPIAEAQQVIKERLPFSSQLTADCAMLDGARRAYYEKSESARQAKDRLHSCVVANCSDSERIDLDREAWQQEKDLELRSVMLSLVADRAVKYVMTLKASRSSFATLYLGRPLSFVQWEKFDSLRSTFQVPGDPLLVSRSNLQVASAPGSAKLKFSVDIFGDLEPVILSGRAGDICDRAERAGGEVFSLELASRQSSLTPVPVKTVFSFGVSEWSEENNVDVSEWLKPMFSELFGNAPYRIETAQQYVPVCKVISLPTPELKQVPWEPPILESLRRPNGSEPDHQPFQFRLFQELQPGSPQIGDWSSVWHEDSSLNVLEIPSPEDVKRLFRAVGLIRANVSGAVEGSSWPLADEFASEADITIIEQGMGMDVRLSVKGAYVGSLRLLRTLGYPSFAIAEVGDTAGVHFTRCYRVPELTSQVPAWLERYRR